MISKTPDTQPIEDADVEVVERQYGDLASVYAENRAAVAKSLGREDGAREWGEVEEAIENKEDV